MQLDVEESTPASAGHDLLISLKNKKIGNFHNANTNRFSVSILSQDSTLVKSV